jgi:hypothetical protein
MRTRCFFYLTAALLLAGSLATVHGQGRERADARTEDSGSNVAVDVDIVFGSGELRLIRSWFGDSHNLQGLPPGLAKRETLPPGLKRQLQKNGTLPPGLEQYTYNVPTDLNRRLPTVIDGISRVIIGGHIALINDSTSVILDIAAIF